MTPYGNMSNKKTFNYNKRFSFFGDNKFISTWKTDNLSTGSSSNNQIKLPLESSGNYNFVVDWGDGSKSNINVYNQAEVTHTYTNIGIYVVKISGTINGFRFNNTGDKSKILYVNKWGCLKLGNSNGYFYGCNNLDILADDYLISPSTVTLASMFRGCTSLTNALKMNTENINNMEIMYYQCANYNKPFMFNTKNVIYLGVCLFGCTIFNQDISLLNIANVATMNNILIGTSWTRENYDKFLISAASQSVKSSVQFGCNATYTTGGAAETARTYLITSKSWTISDGGGV